MELVNFWTIIVCTLITLVWALRKRHEINSMKIAFYDEDELHQDPDVYEQEAFRR